jgi:hypothetical protein
MSDYDDDDEPLGHRQGGYEASRVRTGSEGFEVRPVQPWLRMDGEAREGEWSDHRRYDDFEE